MNSEENLRGLELRLEKIESERISILREINVAREQLAKETEENRPMLGRPIDRKSLSSNSDKVDLFLCLFGARQEIYPRRWENLKTRKSGYAPVCANEWNKPLCDKPKVKCAECPNQRFLPLDNTAVENHLRGSTTIGTYAIRQAQVFADQSIKARLYLPNWLEFA